MSAGVRYGSRRNEGGPHHPGAGSAPRRCDRRARRDWGQQLPSARSRQRPLNDGRVKTALQEKTFVVWLAAAQRVAFGTLTRLAAETRTHHASAVVTPLAVSAGGGLFPEDDDTGRVRRRGRDGLPRSCAGRVGQRARDGLPRSCAGRVGQRGRDGLPRACAGRVRQRGRM